MRIPANSCEGCNRNAKLFPNGRHNNKNANWYICPFVKAELESIPEVQFISIHRTRKAAVKASGGYGSIHWIGQAPHDMWLALRDLKENG